MKDFLIKVRWFFTGLRLFLPLVPRFVWIAIREMYISIVNYWENSQLVVNKISDSYMIQATDKPGRTTDYAHYVYWVCYSIASFLYLLGWLAMSWLTVEALRLLMSAIS
jgi:hypothetical protein